MTLRVDADHAPPVRRGSRWQLWFAEAVRLVLAPVVLLTSGFFTADFLLSGVYTWPRTSRVLVLTLTVLVLAYEFVYKEQRARHPEASSVCPLRALLYSCAIPYGLGALALLALARLVP
ncbi:MAG: hypothetical protein HY581_00805 [Nitrospirae bacterium]|nr:hypothetical protein [Nitrospirota bacterium]